jgi:hypothetical protein
MKLSQKLLALGGVTLADYACCPYDDYGMPHSACTDALPEKTPFSLETDWRNGACKAWESNVDATFDGNDNGCADGSNTNENWGSCGFQRHFPWNEVQLLQEKRNRNCIVAVDGATYSGSAGCYCQGGGDSETGTIKCKTTNAKIETSNTTPEACAELYNPSVHDLMTAAELAGVVGGLCCDASADAEKEVDSVRVDCLRDCAAADVAWLADPAGGNKPQCYKTDFLGRRNIQSNSLWLEMDGTDKFTAGDAGLSFSYSSNPTETTDSSDAAQNKNALKYNLAGVPFLGGVCKLFVPVPMSRIVSVQIAGVHVALHKQSVFPAMMKEANSYTPGTDHVGTAYCFSVVNPAEGMKNSNGIHNGNVAGGSVGNGADWVSGADSVFDQLLMTGTSLERQAGLEPNINFFDGSDSDHIGTQMEDDIGTASGDSEVGANFDVVVHIHSEWCNSNSFWNYADMQLQGDFNNGINDYPLNVGSYAPANSDQLGETGEAYSEAQTGPLELVRFRTAATAADAADTAAGATLTTETTTWTSGTCHAALTTECQDFVTAYATALLNEAQCNADTSQADCSALEAIRIAAKAEVITDDGAAFTGGCIFNNANAGNDLLEIGCNKEASSFEVDEVLAYTNAATAHGTAIGEHISADAALAGAESNGFTHAHMDLIDKRNNMVASYNPVYEANNGYLRYPNSNDDAFLDHAGLADAAAYAAEIAANPTHAADFLRWPNAGAFAAFHSFVACANPPYMADPTNEANEEVNTASIIYAKETTPALTAQAEADAYSYFGSQVLLERTLVMSQSDSDYRDQNCNQRTFRANLRQVGNSITVCGPGQLPDTDTKRCTWNWNYNAASSDIGNSPNVQTGDAEEWFDRNNPHNFDMWSTRKRRTAQANDRKYAFNMGYWGVQQGNAYGAMDPFDADTQTHADEIQIPITPYIFNLKFKNARNGDLPNSASAGNAANCFLTTCDCRPSVAELNAYGFEDSAGLPIVFTDSYATDFTTTYPDLWHSGCSDNVNVNSASPTPTNKCNAADRVPFDTNLDAGNLAQECFGFLSDNTGGFYFENDHSKQDLVFDAESNSQVTTAFNPSSNHWEVSVHCKTPTPDNAALLPTEAQRDFFPECFFGDELWFTMTYGTGSDAAANNNNLSYNSYASAWFSEVNVNGDGDFTQAYLPTA